MDFFSVLALLGGLAIFLYGMNLMGDGLAKVAGRKLERILETLTSNPIRAVLLGMGDCSDPVILGNYRYGRWFCKLGNHEAVPGCGNHYGCQYRYYRNLMDLKSYRYPE